MAKGWHYQVMRHTATHGGQDYSYLAVHEYYPSELFGEGEEAGWTEEPVTVSGDDIDDIKWMLKAILNDIDKYGVKGYNE